MEGLDTHANLAMLGEGEALPTSAQATTNHPRHRPGCSCIVCIQSPSGKGPKHKQTCTRNVQRRFRALKLRYKKKQSERKAETTRRKQQQQHPQPLPSSEISLDEDSLPCSNIGDSGTDQNEEGSEISDGDPSQEISSSWPFKGLIDLNMPPEQQEENYQVKSSSWPFKGQMDLNIPPEREEGLASGSDSCS